MKILAILITTLFFNNALACLDVEFNNLSCVENDEYGTSNFEILHFKLTKSSITSTYVVDGQTFTDEVILPSVDQESGIKLYCEGKNLVNEQSYITTTDRGVTVFNEKGFVLTGSEKLRQCHELESHEECIANNRPIKELKYKVTCSVKN